MGYIADNLTQGERIVFTTNRHWWMWLSGIVPMFVTLFITNLIISGLKSPNSASTATVLSCFMGLICVGGVASIILNLVAWASSELGVTNRRILSKRGLIARRVAELNLTQFESCDLSETLVGRLLGYKTVTVKGSGGTHYVFTFVCNAPEFRNHVIEQATSGSRIQEHHAQMATMQTAMQYEQFKMQQQMQQKNMILPSGQQHNISASLFDLPPEEPTARIKQATDFIKAGKRQEATDIVKTLMQSHPNSADVWYLAGYLHTDTSKKRESYEKALTLNPNHNMARSALNSLL